MQEHDISSNDEIPQSFSQQGCFLRAAAAPILQVHGPGYDPHPLNPGSNKGRRRENTKGRTKQPRFKTTLFTNRLLTLPQIPAILPETRLPAIVMPESVIAERVASIENFSEQPGCLLNATANNKEYGAYSVLIESIKNCWRNLRVRAIIEGEQYTLIRCRRQFADDESRRYPGFQYTLKTHWRRGLQPIPVGFKSEVFVSRTRF